MGFVSEGIGEREELQLVMCAFWLYHCRTRTAWMVSTSFWPCMSCPMIGPLSSGAGSLVPKCRCFSRLGRAVMCEDGGSGRVAASVKGVVCFVGVRSSSGIGVSGRSLKVGAVDGQLPRLMMDCEEQLSISLLESGSSAHGPRCTDGRTVASRRENEAGDIGSGEDKDVFKRPSLMRLRSSLSATWSRP